MKFNSMVLIAVLSVSACSVLGDNHSLSGGLVNFDPGTPGMLPTTNYDNKSIMFVDLMTELDPENYSGWTGHTGASAPAFPKSVCDAKKSSDLRSDEQFSCAISGFYNPGYMTVDHGVAGEEEKLEIIRFRRNRVQDRIILASNLACDEYRRHLLTTQSEVNFLYGNAATLTAGLGAILTPPGTSQALAGASAIISGSRAEYNSNYYRKLLAEVITRGIAESRDQVFEKIKKKQLSGITNYSVEQALADAVQYNSKCTLIAGLESAQAAQSFYADPGLEHLSELLTGKSGNVPALFATLNKLDAATPGPGSEGAASKVAEAVFAAAQEAAKKAEDDAVAAEAKVQANPDDQAAQVEAAALRRIAIAVAAKAAALKPPANTEPDRDSSAKTEGLNN